MKYVSLQVSFWDMSHTAPIHLIFGWMICYATCHHPCTDEPIVSHIIQSTCVKKPDNIVIFVLSLKFGAPTRRSRKYRSIQILCY